MSDYPMTTKPYLTFADYQDIAYRTALPSARTHVYMTLGLAGEAIELDQSQRLLHRLLMDLVAAGLVLDLGRESYEGGESKKQGCPERR